jgi:hypothetical protein
MDEFAVAPHALIPALAIEIVGLLDQHLAFGLQSGGLSCQYAGHGSGLHNLLMQSFAATTRQRRWMIFKGHSFLC